MKEDATNVSTRMFMAQLHEDRLKDAYDRIMKNGVLNVTENTESHLKGRIDLAAGKLLYTSIPYDKGWSVFVDGEKVGADDIVKIGDALLGVRMAAGEHDVEFKYSPAGLKEGALATVVGILIVVALVIYKKKKLLFYSPRMHEQYGELGKWRDHAAEQQAEEYRIGLEEEMQAMIREAEQENPVTEETGSAWEAALDEVEADVRQQQQEEEVKPEDE